MDVVTPRPTVPTAVCAAAGAGAAAMRYQFGPGLSLCLVVAVALAPVWLSVLKEYRGARLLLALAIGAAAWGAVLTLSDTERPSSTSLLIASTSQLLSLVGGAGLLLWARSLLGVAWTVVAFGAGALVNVVLTGGNPANLWKYSLAVPVALIVLGLCMLTRSRLAPIVALTAFAAISALSDSRSMTSFMLMAVAALIWQASAPTVDSRPRPWQTLLWLSAAALGAYMLLQALILEGVLGEAAAQRSQAQLDTSGSLITGGRPELGAAVALIGARPLGYGSGTVPVSSDVWLAKTGMHELGYNPNNGYVDVFMFGGHYEVHSVTGDLWVWFGPLGAALVALIVATGVAGTATRLSTRAASGVLVLLTLLGTWDALFSPMLTSYRTLALLFAVAALPVARGLVTAAPAPSSHRSGASAWGRSKRS